MPPPAQSDLLYWLRADTDTYQVRNAHTTPAVADGDLVGTWGDKSGNGHDFSPDTDGNRPVLKLAIYGSKQIIRFNTTAFLAATVSTAGITEAEGFVVVKKVANSDERGIWRLGSSTDSNHHRYSDNHIYDSFYSTVRKDAGTGGPNFSSAFTVYNVTSKSGGWTCRADGTQIFTTATNTVGPRADLLIGGGGSPVGSLNGDIAELLVYNRELTTQERADALSYLQDDTSWATPATGRLIGPGGGLINRGSKLIGISSGLIG